MRLFHFISEKHALDVIAHQRLKVSMLNGLNDPFELIAVELSDKHLRDKYKAFKHKMAKKYGVLCFSKTWKSPLLWSHYADRHKGVALEFEVLDDVAHPITYRTNRYVLNRKGGGLGFDKRDIQGIWLTKYKQWEYEDEVRVIVSMSECDQQEGICFYRLGQDIHLKGIVLGPLCGMPIVKIKKHLPKKLRISVIQSRLAFRSFAIVRKKSIKKVILSGLQDEDNVY